MLKAGPVTVAADFLRRAVKIKADVAGVFLFDPALKRAVRRLIVAGIDICLPSPAAFLSIRDLAALDDC
jgi:hypothetical protein